MRIPKIACHLVTNTILLLVIIIATQGEFFHNLVKYPSDTFVLGILLVLGYLLTEKIIKYSPEVSFINIAMSSLLYYFAYCVFSDGYVAGWTHSTGVTDKLFMGIMISMIFVIAIFPPLIAIVIASLHNLVIGRLCKSNKQQQ